MDDTFRSKLQAKLADYRAWQKRRRLSACRLVQYCGVDLIGVHEVPLTQVETRIQELVCEGFFVDWDDRQGKLYLRVWEYPGPEPDWSKILVE